jgi:hypothetical protein
LQFALQPGVGLWELTLAARNLRASVGDIQRSIVVIPTLQEANHEISHHPVARSVELYTFVFQGK